jgi:hypothetical protein
MKYDPLLRAIRNNWCGVEFICIPIGHAGATLIETLATRVRALVAPCPSPKTISHLPPSPHVSKDMTVIKHNRNIATALLDRLCALA